MVSALGDVTNQMDEMELWAGAGLRSHLGLLSCCSADQARMLAFQKLDNRCEVPNKPRLERGYQGDES